MRMKIEINETYTGIHSKFLTKEDYILLSSSIGMYGNMRMRTLASLVILIPACFIDMKIGRESSFFFHKRSENHVMYSYLYLYYIIVSELPITEK